MCKEFIQPSLKNETLTTGCEKCEVAWKSQRSSKQTLQSFKEQAQKAHSETRTLEFYGATIRLLAYLFIVYCL